MNPISSGDSNTYVQRLFAVTPKDMQRIAQTYLMPNKMTLDVVGDKSKIADQLTPFGEVAN